MTRGINKVILVGNCGNDPETRYTPGGAAITNISIATTSTHKDKQTGQPVDKTEWHRVVFFNRLAEIAGEYLKKGSQVYIDGRLQTRKWQDQSGQDRYTTEIVAGEMQMLGGRGDGMAQPQQQHRPARPQVADNELSPALKAMNGDRNAYAEQQQKRQPVPVPAGANEDFDDDIPF